MTEVAAKNSYDLHGKRRGKGEESKRIMKKVGRKRRKT